LVSDSQTAQSIIRDSQPLAQGDDLQLVDDDKGVTFQDDDLSAPNVNDDGPRLEDDLLVFSQDGDDETLGIIIQRPYFNRTFQPYDWYAKAKTWVRYFTFLSATMLVPVSSPMPSREVLLQVCWINSRTAVF
jgi:hypothetical protein